MNELETKVYIEDKTSPKSLETERALLGVLLIKGELFPDVLEILSSTAFYLSKNRAIYKAMNSLYDEQEAIDSITVTAKLEKMSELINVGGKEYLTQLIEEAPTTLNVKTYSNIIQEKYIKRRLINAGEAIASRGYSTSTDIGQIVDEAEKILFDISQSHFTVGYSALEKKLPALVDQIIALKDKSIDHRGVSSGIDVIDNKLSGFQKSDLIIIAARPSIGKTSLALDIARKSALKHNTSIGLFSLEMSSIQLTERMLSAESRIPAWNLRTGKLKGDDALDLITEAANCLSKAPIYIDDTAGASTLHIKSTARRMKREKNIDMLIVDYLQLVRPYNMEKNESMVHQITEVSRTMKQIARDLDIPVVVLSQLSRDVEKRSTDGSAKPRLSDLRDSGSIEQDADVVMFLYKEKERRHKGEDELTDTNNEVEVLNVDIAKHRNGPTGHFKLNFHKGYSTFVDPASINQEKMSESFSDDEIE